MTFSMGLTENKTVYYSYFNRIPYGCRNIFPMITAGLSIVIVVLVAAGYNHSLRRNGFVSRLMAPVSDILPDRARRISSAIRVIYAKGNTKQGLHARIQETGDRSDAQRRVKLPKNSASA